MSDTPEDEPQPPPIVRITRSLSEEAPIEEVNWDIIDAQDKAKALRALFSNRIFAQPDGLHLRLSFGEWVQDETVYHTAIVVPNEQALEMGKLLVSMATASIENQIAHYRHTLLQTGEQAPEQGASADGD